MHNSPRTDNILFNAVYVNLEQAIKRYVPTKKSRVDGYYG